MTSWCSGGRLTIIGVGGTDSAEVQIGDQFSGLQMISRAGRAGESPQVLELYLLFHVIQCCIHNEICN